MFKINEKEAQFLPALKDRVSLRKENDGAEIHFGTGPSWWGKGFVTEAGKAVMNWVEKSSALSEITTCCAADHAASLTVLQKTGLQHTRHLPAYLHLSASDQKVDAWVCRWNRLRADNQKRNLE